MVSRSAKPAGVVVAFSEMVPTEEHINVSIVASGFTRAHPLFCKLIAIVFSLDDHRVGGLGCYCR